MVNNYRPVSVLPIVTIIIVKHVFNSFYEYLSVNNLITSCLSDFRFETAINSLVNRLLKYRLRKVNTCTFYRSE